MNNNKIRLPLSLLMIVVSFFFLFKLDTKAQFQDRFSVAFGISTIEILGNNPGRLPVFERDSTKSDVVGGGFGGPQPGFALQFMTYLDKKERFRIPIGFDQYFYSSAQRLPYNNEVEFSLKHKVTVSTFSLGLDWAFIEFPLAEAKLFVGLHAMGTFVYGDEYTVFIDYNNVPRNDTTIVHPSKEATFRLGGFGKFGIEGRIYERWYLNISGSLSMMNLLLRDEELKYPNGNPKPMERGELFTPKVSKEYEESFVSNFQFRFLVQYRL